ncbi:disease resistance protein RPV1-like [Eucalyptus grandis]|uniref:disease resistance protein RPV1-like n=1 Tax=Eucalyptus grandis TaxID=71139 RepID=UPI00192EF666|nr:disease resistance protein RPV1-like [Eucalyptus grandis]
MLKKLQKVPPKEVRETLMISYEGLEPTQQKVFPNIACFFIKEDKKNPIFMWSNCEYHPHNAIRVLLLPSLLKIGDDNRFLMHDQVSDLGRHIVYEENCRFPGKRSRVWIPEDTSNLLRNKKASEEVEALSLSFNGQRNGSGYTFTGEELQSLRNLRFLRGKGLNFVGVINIPDSIGNLKKLKIIRMQNTKIRKLPDAIGQLEMLHCPECQSLSGEIPCDLGNLSRFKDFGLIRHSHLWIASQNQSSPWPRRTSVEGVPGASTSARASLKYKLKGPCQSEELLSAWKIIESIDRLPSILSTLHLTDVSPPQRFCNFRNLSSLFISSCSMAHLPVLEHLEKLREMSIKVCPSLERIPDLSCLKNLENLYLSELGSLVEIQDPGELESLESLEIICCESLEGLPHLSKLAKLKPFELPDCQVLRTIEGLSHLQCLNHLTIMVACPWKGCLIIQGRPS